MADSVASPTAAPSYNVPRERIVSIEHPCIIKNFENGLKSLGGEQQLKHVIEHDVGDSIDPKVERGAEPAVGVSLHLDDPFTKKLPSTANFTANVLMKVTLPKRTGRKRKRGSTEPYTRPREPDSTTCITATELLQRMRDNPDHVQVEAVGIITDTHRFRDLPDIQFQGGELPIMRELRDHVIEPRYAKVKDFKPSIASGDRSGTFPAPPTFLPPSRSMTKKTRQADGPSAETPAHRTAAEGEPDEPVLSASRQKAPTLRDIQVNLETTPVPKSAPSTLDPPERNSAIDQIVTQFRSLLADRPIFTRRAYRSRFQDRADKSVRRALPHVAYYLDSGPWRYSIVAHGVDPRADPKYRFYQTFGYSGSAQVAIKDGSAYGHPNKDLRVFDGTQSVDPSETWPLCDLTEPLVQRIVGTENIRSECDSKWGWFYNGTIAKVIVVMREKMIALANPGRKDNLTEEEYGILADLPDEVKKTEDYYLDSEVYPKHVCKLAEAIGDEAMNPTFMGIRGYEEVIPNPLASLMAVGGSGVATPAESDLHHEDEEDPDGEIVEDVQDGRPAVSMQERHAS
jgi:general transcription factor 3C polypeptide 5 (transcription factor C subunit 1)